MSKGRGELWLALFFSTVYGQTVKTHRVSISMDEPMWHVLSKLQFLVNKILLQSGKKPVQASGVLSMIVQNSLLAQAEAIVNEHAQLGATNLIEYLVSIDEANADLLPVPLAPRTSKVPNARRTRRTRPPDLNPECPSRALPGTTTRKAGRDVRGQSRTPGEVLRRAADTLDRNGLHEEAALARGVADVGRRSSRLHGEAKTEGSSEAPASKKEGGADELQVP